MNILDVALAGRIAASGGGGGGSGTDNYNDLSNLPQINGVTLAGDKTPESLGLQGELTFDTEPAEDSTNPVESGGVYSELAKKQDNLTFDGTYDASTNKAATESTVTNAINELDVSATSFDADETISSISETDGKVSVTKQDIAIASNQVVAMTGYAKPSSAPANPAIQTNDTANQAIGKLEFKADTNQTNIWYVLGKTGKNFLDCSLDRLKAVNNEGTWNGNVYTVASVGTVTINSDKTITVVKTGTSARLVFYLSSNQEAAAISGDKFAGYILSGCPSGGSSTTYRLTGEEISSPWITVSNDYGNGDTIQSSTLQVGFYISIHADYTTTGSGLTFKPMICTEEDWNVSPDYQPYRGLPNYDLTVREAEDRAALAEVVDSGAKNKFDLQLSRLKEINNASNGWTWNNNVATKDVCTCTVNSDGSVCVQTTGSPTSNNIEFVLFSGSVDTIFKESGSYALSGCPTGGSNTTYSIWFCYTDNWTGVFGNADETGSGIINDVPSSNRAAQMRITIRTTAPAIDKVFKPMICTEADWKISQNYAPFALPNTDLTRMVNDLQKKAVKVYTYHVNPNESDPEDAVTYLDDATGLTPAKMGASSFSYGSWANAWFLPRPCMLKSDGTVAYYLNPNDYSKKTDGAASDIADANFDGNVMLEFPKIWVKRVASSASGERTVSIAPVNVDGTYKCWSNINAEDKEVDHFYLPAYNGTIHSSKMRSLSGVTLNSAYAPNYTRAQEVTAATANNPTGKNMWYTETWVDMCLVYDLLYLMGKSLDVQRTFGQGLSSGSETAMRAYVTGTHNAKGLFYGDISGTSTAVKVLGMENLWGCRWHGVAGLINDNGTLKVKMTYGVADGSTAVGYNTTGSGYLNYGSTYGTNGYVKKMQADNMTGYKIIETAGTDATYYCDYYYVNNSQSNYALLGGSSGVGAFCGFCVHLSGGAASANWDVGGSLSCRPES